MLFSSLKHALILSLFLLFQHYIYAETIAMTPQQEISILKKCQVLFDNKDTGFKDIVTQQKFHTYDQPTINTSIVPITTWIRCTLQNDSNISQQKIMVLTSPLLEEITLYTDDNTSQNRGVAYITRTHQSLYPYFKIEIPPNHTRTYYLRIHSTYTPVDFRLLLSEEDIYLPQDRDRQFINILLIGFILALMVYSFILHFYTKDKSYLYYSFYLFALIYQQLTYLGLTQIYFPLPFITIDMQMPIIKIGALVITSALFAISFLKTKQYKNIYRIYQAFIIISLLEMLFLVGGTWYNLYIVIFTGTLFIFFNLSAGVVSYRHGNKQARLFIVGFSIVALSYCLIILDALGFTSVMQHFQNILMFGTAFEALVLSLAFADRYIILQKEKAQADARILEETSKRADIIHQEVIKKTHALNSALETKDLLIKEVHHRVKNNLQIILSIIRLQQDRVEDTDIHDIFISLENRINAISKTYDMLLIKENLEKIDMSEYINSLLSDIQDTMYNYRKTITIETKIDAMVPLRESVYIGLIVNELVTNAYKYAFEKEGTITISLLQHNNHYTLKVADDGKGYDSTTAETSLGLRLIHTLVYDQLEGTMEKETVGKTVYTIRFTI